jgi:hypothetical protein
MLLPDIIHYPHTEAPDQVLRHFRARHPACRVARTLIFRRKKDIKKATA